MTPDTGRPTDRDYLWNPAAPPDTDVKALERSLASLRFEHRSPPLRLARRSPVRWRPLIGVVAAGLFFAFVGGAMLWQWRESWPSGRAWPVTLHTPHTAAQDVSTLEVDRTLQLGATVSADVRIARIGEMRVAPGSALTLSETASARHRIVLDHGDVSVRVWAPPGRFAIRTPAGDVTDLGCIFDLSVTAAGATVLRVETGWVQLSNFQGESLVPAGASATMTRAARPSVPVYDDAAPQFTAAVRAFELAADAASRANLARELGRGARPRDVLTLLVLANAAPDSFKRAILERAAELIPPPTGLTVDRILDDRSRLWVWYDALDLPPAKAWWLNWRDAFPHARR